MGYVNDFVFGVLLGPQSDITREDIPCLGYRREREVDMKRVPEGLYSCRRMLQWELALQLMQAVVLSKGTAK